LSTGPRTAEGKARRSAHVKAEWAQWRLERGLPPWWRFDPSRRKGARVSAAAYVERFGPWDGRPREEFEAEPEASH
jgi:hypothetical protein